MSEKKGNVGRHSHVRKKGNVGRHSHHMFKNQSFMKVSTCTFRRFFCAAARCIVGAHRSGNGTGSDLVEFQFSDSTTATTPGILQACLQSTRATLEHHPTQHLHIHLHVHIHMTMTMTMAHSSKVIQQLSGNWPNGLECQGHDPV